MSAEERQRLDAVLRLPGNEPVSQLILIALHTGMRQGELLGLKVQQVDFAKKVLHVEHTKTDEDRDVCLNDTACAILADLAAQARGYGSEYVFNNPKTKTRYNNVRKRYASVLRAAQIEGCRFHDLRHTFATHAGADPLVNVTALADVLGHKDWRTTMRYAHATDEAKRRVSEVQERVG